MTLTFTQDGNTHTARDTTKHYVIAREHTGDRPAWSLTIRKLRHDGITPGPLLTVTAHDSKTRSVDVANGYHDLGDDYWPARLGGRDRIAEAMARVYPAPEPVPATEMTDAEHLAAAQAERVTTLRELAADRPAHATYLEQLLAAAPGLLLDDILAPRGVSGRVALALIDDVAWCRQPYPDHGRPTQYPAAYTNRRQTDALSARDRAATRAQNQNGPGTLRDLINLG